MSVEGIISPTHSFIDISSLWRGTIERMMSKPPRRCPRRDGAGVSENGGMDDRCKICDGAGWGPRL